MSFEFTPYLLPLVAAAALNAALARHTWARRQFPGAIAMGGFMAALAEWSLAYALVLAATDLDGKMFWYRVEYLGVLMGTFCWPLFVAQYIGWEHQLRRPLLGALALWPATILALVWTNDWHGLMWPTRSLEEVSGLRALHVTFGPAYWANIAIGYPMILGGSVVLAVALARRRRLYALQAVSLVVGVLAPLVGNMLYNASLVGPVDLAPFGFTVSGILWWLGFARFRVLDVAPVSDPVALERIFESMVDGVVVLDAAGAIVKANPAATEVMGSGAAMRLPQPVPDLLDQQVHEARTEITLGADATCRHLDLRLSPLRHRSGALAGHIIALRDVTDRKRAEEALAHQARHDVLTGLPNRMLLRDRLAEACDAAARDEFPVGLLFVDLDNFKTVNDSLGHAAGDELLIMVADRLRAAIRPGDLVARLGGDEFAVVLGGAADPLAAQQVAARIIDSMRQPFTIGVVEVVSGASIGIALSGADAARPGDLLRNADAALHAAKAHGKGRLEFFMEDMHRAAQARLAMHGEVRRALERQEFVMYYQPVVNLRTGDIVGCEALVRWVHPERGLVPPLDFVPVCEELGLIVPLGEWILREACTAQHEWRERFPLQPAPVVTVNVSPRQLQQPDFVERVALVLKETAADPRQLVLEITEGVLLQDGDTTLEVLQQLRQLGLQLAVDDFGTGYSALSYLQRYPINVLKIDRSFVNGLARGGQRSALVRAIVALGQALNLKLVAEGIEHADQQEQLQALGCELGQGYLYAAPLPRPEFERRLQAAEEQRAAQPLTWSRALLPRAA